MTLRAFRYRFYPTHEQESLLRRTVGCVRLVYNKALEARSQAWKERQEKVGYRETSKMLTQWKKEEELQFLGEVSAVPLQQGLRHLDRGYSNFFAGRAKYPRFKKKRNGGSAEFTKAAFRWRNGSLYLAKSQEPLNIRWSRQLPKGAEPSTVTVRLEPSGRWHVSILADDDTVKPLPQSEKSVGVDVGIAHLAITSDGEKVENPRHLTKHYKRLRRAQKSLSRKIKGSRNREKARRQVAKIHEQIKDSRSDYLHKLTTRLVRENQTIAVEDLSVKNLLRNHKLAKHISDCAWGEFVNQLDYKCQWYGRTLVKVDKWFPSSKLCASCGHQMDSMPLSVREWTCPKCGTVHDRDINAAKNLLAELRDPCKAVGHTVSACGASVRLEGSRSGEQLQKTRKRKKQEPKSRGLGITVLPVR
ncbi:RNA-guided endonuclease InsQ/TnpB family protein [Baaleninema simplex]|uniref:RNA-guided endonuclease InsQ/TnpB family protein n=1 Tax=Baaleninema simplex TaxID=2862350 RepID=UPI00034C0B04|nr:RNA-guided endonuclease TnpB family protein [Baaleninema simplex]